MDPRLATTQQRVAADAIDDTGVLWSLSLLNETADTGHGSPLSDLSDAGHTSGQSYSQLHSTAACLPDQIRNASDTRPVGFPFLINSNPPAAANRNLTRQTEFGIENYPVIQLPDLFYSQLLDLKGDNHKYRLKWIDVPRDFFVGSSIGAAILLPFLKPEAV